MSLQCHVTIFMSILVSWVKVCSSGWPQTHDTAPASDSPVLRYQVEATTWRFKSNHLNSLQKGSLISCVCFSAVCVFVFMEMHSHAATSHAQRWGRGLEKWFSSLEFLPLLQRTWLWFPAPCRVAHNHNCSCSEFNALFRPPLVLVHMWLLYTGTYIHIYT